MHLRLLVVALVAAAAAAPPVSAPTTGAAAQSAVSADEQEIRRLQQQWMDAWARQDIATIEWILAPDYSLTVSAMPSRPVTREQWIGLLSRYTAEGFEYRDMRVRLLGDIAVVSSIGRAIGGKVGGKDRSFPFFVVDVWRKRDGRWQVVARYSSIPEQAGASAEALKE